MSEKGKEQVREQTRPLDSVYWKLVQPSLNVGVATGTCGAIYGRVAGTLIQSPNPWPLTGLAAAQWCATGTTFFYCRSLLLSSLLSRDRHPHKVAASGIAGSCSALAAMAFVPRTNPLPTAIVFGIAAASTQAVLNIMPDSNPFSTMASSLGSKIGALSPMKSLSDEQYEDLLRQKLFKVEVSIAVLDDEIAQVRAARDQRFADRLR